MVPIGERSFYLISGEQTHKNNIGFNIIIILFRKEENTMHTWQRPNIHKIVRYHWFKNIRLNFILKREKDHVDRNDSLQVTAVSKTQPRFACSPAKLDLLQRTWFYLVFHI